MSVVNLTTMGENVNKKDRLLNRNGNRTEKCNRTEGILKYKVKTFSHGSFCQSKEVSLSFKRGLFEAKISQ